MGICDKDRKISSAAACVAMQILHSKSYNGQRLVRDHGCTFCEQGKRNLNDFNKKEKNMAKKQAKIRQTDAGKEKYCPKGKHWVKMDKDHFYNDARSKTGFTSYCKACQCGANITPREKADETAQAKVEPASDKKMVLTLDFSGNEILFRGILQAAADELRTPAMQIMWMASKTLYQERNITT